MENNEEQEFKLLKVYIPFIRYCIDITDNQEYKTNFLILIMCIKNKIKRLISDRKWLHQLKILLRNIYNQLKIENSGDNGHNRDIFAMFGYIFENTNLATVNHYQYYQEKYGRRDFAMQRLFNVGVIPIRRSNVAHYMKFYPESQHDVIFAILLHQENIAMKETDNVEENHENEDEEYEDEEDDKDEESDEDAEDTEDAEQSDYDDEDDNYDEENIVSINFNVNM